MLEYLKNSPFYLLQNTFIVQFELYEKPMLCPMLLSKLIRKKNMVAMDQENFDYLYCP
jgi:hypothetical protein